MSCTDLVQQQPQSVSNVSSMIPLPFSASYTARREIHHHHHHELEAGTRYAFWLSPASYSTVSKAWIGCGCSYIFGKERFCDMCINTCLGVPLRWWSCRSPYRVPCHVARNHSVILCRRAWVRLGHWGVGGNAETRKHTEQWTKNIDGSLISEAQVVMKRWG